MNNLIDEKNFMIFHLKYISENFKFIKLHFFLYRIQKKYYKLLPCLFDLKNFYNKKISIIYKSKVVNIENN